jgi:protein-disulfide isomerase
MAPALPAFAALALVSACGGPKAFDATTSCRQYNLASTDAKLAAARQTYDDDVVAKYGSRSGGIVANIDSWCQQGPNDSLGKATIGALRSYDIAPTGADATREATSKVRDLNFARNLVKDIPQQGAYLGSSDAPVTIVAVVSAGCSFCATWFTDPSDPGVEPLQKVIDDGVKPGKVRLLLAPYSMPQGGAAEANYNALVARLAARNQAWTGLAALYANHSGTGQYYDGITPEILVDAVDKAFPGSASGSEQDVQSKVLDRAKQLVASKRINTLPSFLYGPSDKDPSSYKLVPTGAGGRPGIEGVIQGP